MTDGQAHEGGAPAPCGRLRQLARVVPVYAKLAWWGLAAPHLGERESLVVVQAVIRDRGCLLLSVRSDLRGYELPGGTPAPGEPYEAALRREVREETGLEIGVDRLVGTYTRTGFRPHTARVYLCRPAGGHVRPSHETPVVRWLPEASLPSTLFPWYRGPIADALAERPSPVERHEHQGLWAVLAGARIDLRMRLGPDPPA